MSAQPTTAEFVRHARPRHLRAVVDAEVAPSAVGGATPPSVYRRRRLAVVAVLALLTVLLTVLIDGVGAEAQPDGPPAVEAVTVAPGETLWDVAVEYAPAGTDPRDYLATIRSLNGLDGSRLEAWSVILLPER